MIITYKISDYVASMKNIQSVYEEKGIDGVQMYCVTCFVPLAVAYSYLLKSNKDDKLVKRLEGVVNFYKCEVVD